MCRVIKKDLVGAVRELGSAVRAGMLEWHNTWTWISVSLIVTETPLKLFLNSSLTFPSPPPQMFSREVIPMDSRSDVFVRATDFAHNRATIWSYDTFLDRFDKLTARYCAVQVQDTSCLVQYLIWWHTLFGILITSIFGNGFFAPTPHFFSGRREGGRWYPHVRIIWFYGDLGERYECFGGHPQYLRGIRSHFS